MINDIIDYYKETGKYYGYPDCCIVDFCNRHIQGGVLTYEQEKVHQNFGFIPCPDCARKVFNKEIRLTDLIKNRICEFNFPKEHKTYKQLIKNDY